MFDVIVVGGGAAGFYFAIHLAERRPNMRIAIFERNKNVLSKVRISGGGRCNVTNAEAEPAALAQNYPRGEKELLGPFHHHGPSDVFCFFERRGVPMKTELDGRVFPKSDSSQSVIDCLLGESERLGISVFKNSMVNAFALEGDSGLWRVDTVKKHYRAGHLMLASGSSAKIWGQLDRLGHTIIDPVPSLFTFVVDDDRLQGLQGLSTTATIAVMGKAEPLGSLESQSENGPVLKEEGPALITHTGLSGPAVLRLSAWGATRLHAYGYRFRIEVNWAPEHSTNGLLAHFLDIKGTGTKKTVARTKAIDVPGRLWANLIAAAGIDGKMRWADTTRQQLRELSLQVTKSTFFVKGRSTYKEEFVTAGGVDLKEIDFKSFKSKKLPKLYLAGEIINVDGITGGYNFQNAWTGAYLAAQGMAAEPALGFSMGF